MILLLKNYKVKRKDDHELTEKDLRDSKYILIDTATDSPEESKNYVMIDPSNIPYFDRAEIIYQLIFMYDDHDNGQVSFEPIPPVFTETGSLSDVINLLNCINRLYLVNTLLSNDMYLYSSAYFIIGYFEVKLYKGNKKVYDKTYNRTDIDDDKKLQKLYGEGFKVPLKVIKKFKDIYNIDIIHELILNNQSLFISKDMTWCISSMVHGYLLIGLPLFGSRTISLFSDIEFLLFMGIQGMSITYSIIFINNNEHRYRINELIRKDKYDELGEMNNDFIIVSNLDYGYKDSIPYRNFYIDILAHIGFSIRLTNMAYYYLEGYEESMTDDGDGVDTIVSFNIKTAISYKKKGRHRSFFLNEDNLIPFDQLIKLI